MPAGRFERGPVICPFRRATGLPCPTCGLTRSWNAAAHGRLGASLALHPLGPVTLAGAAAYAAGLDRRNPELTRKLSTPAILWSLAAAWTAVWVVRLMAERRRLARRA